MKHIISFLGLLLLAVTLQAQILGNEVRVVVSPNHTDWNYKLKEPCTFTVQVFKAQNVVKEPYTLDYELGPEWYPTDTARNITVKDGVRKFTSTMNTPGFLRLKVTVHYNDHEYTGLATAGYAVDKIQPLSTEPKDFLTYWQDQLAYCRQEAPLDLWMELWGDHCTELDNVYKVSYQVQPWGGRYYGVLTVPKAPGKYPALLRVPGAGVRPYNGDTYTAPGKLIVLEVGVHGIPIDMPQNVYDALHNGALSGYWCFNDDDKDRFYYHRVIIGAVRGVDVICSLPQYNGEALGVMGSSQGGALSLITTALDKRITCCAPIHPALCDHEAFAYDRAGGWPHYYHSYGQLSDRQKNTLKYYDGVNFARHITVPCWFSFGYNDEVVPPTSMYAAYNVITAPKECYPYLETGHYWYQEQYDQWQDWMRKELGIGE